MEREASRQDFMGKFGDPLDGLDLRKPIVLWFPTYFTVVRIIFAVGSVYLWDAPTFLLVVRLITSMIGFIILSVVQPHESSLQTRLEMMNEVTFIFLVDCIMMFTGILNVGNVNDSNSGTTPNL